MLLMVSSNSGISCHVPVCTRYTKHQAYKMAWFGHILVAQELNKACIYCQGAMNFRTDGVYEVDTVKELVFRPI
jgi:hypothetical protein